MTILEVEEEGRFRSYVREKGYQCLKLNPNNLRGVPDRLIIGPNRFIWFVELKRPEGKTDALQHWWRHMIAHYGFKSDVVKSYSEAINRFSELIR